MTAQDPAHNPIAAALHAPTDEPPATLRDRLDRLSDRVNPIVVMHLRQMWRNYMVLIVPGLAAIGAALVYRFVLVNDGYSDQTRRTLGTLVATLNGGFILGSLSTFSLASVARKTGQKGKVLQAELGQILMALGNRRFVRGTVLASAVGMALAWLPLLPLAVCTLTGVRSSLLPSVVLALMIAMTIGPCFSVFLLAAEALKARGWLAAAGRLVFFVCGPLMIGLTAYVPIMMEPATRNAQMEALTRWHMGGMIMCWLMTIAAYCIAVRFLRPLPPGAAAGNALTPHSEGSGSS